MATIASTRKKQRTNSWLWSIYIFFCFALAYYAGIYFLIIEDRLNWQKFIIQNSHLNLAENWPFFAFGAIIIIIFNLIRKLYHGAWDKNYLKKLIIKIVIVLIALCAILFLRMTPIIYIFDSNFFNLSLILGSREILAVCLSGAWVYLAINYFCDLKIRFAYPLYFLILLITAGILHLLNAVLPYINFQSPASDVGLFNQVIWNFSRFHEPFSTIRGVTHVWADHFHPILILLSPIYAFFKGPLPILVIQALVFVSGVIPIYLIAKKIVKNNFIAWAACFAYLFYPGMQIALNFGFYPENMGPALFAWAFWFVYQTKIWQYFLFLILWLATKEDVSVFVVFLGLYIWIFGKDIKFKNIIGPITLILGLIWFKVATGIIIPSHANDFLPWAKVTASKYMYFNYDQLGSSALEVVKNIFKNPLHVLYIFLNPSVKVFTMLSIACSFGIVALFSPVILIAMPMFMENFLANRQTLWEFHFHYQAQFTAVLTISFIFAVAYFSNKFSSLRQNIYIGFGVLIIASSIYMNFLIDSPFLGLQKLNLKSFTMDKEITGILYKIPVNASVSAQNTLAPYLSQRDEIYLYPRADQVEYIVLAPELSRFPLSDEEYKISLCNLIIKKNDFQLLDYNAKVLLFIRGHDDSRKISSQEITLLRNKYCQ